MVSKITNEREKRVIVKLPLKCKETKVVESEAKKPKTEEPKVEEPAKEPTQPRKVDTNRSEDRKKICELLSQALGEPKSSGIPRLETQC